MDTIPLKLNLGKYLQKPQRVIYELYAVIQCEDKVNKDFGYLEVSETRFIPTVRRFVKETQKEEWITFFEDGKSTDARGEMGGEPTVIDIETLQEIKGVHMLLYTRKREPNK